MRWRLSGAAVLTLAAVLASHPAARGGDQSQTPERGVRCPVPFSTEFDSGRQVLRCVREEIEWSMTVCPDPAYGQHVRQRGADVCAPTEAPGVQAAGARPVACPSEGYSVVVDRDGVRDRCERSRRVYIYPVPVT